MRQDMKLLLKRTLQDDMAQGSDAAMARILRQAEQEMQRQKPKRRKGLLPMMKVQLRYAGWKIWLVQFLSVLLSMAAVRRMNAASGFTPGRMALFLCMVSAMLAMMTMPFLYRSARYMMLETESAAWISGRRLLLARVLMFLVGDAVFLLAVILFAATRTKLGWQVCAGNLLLPFLMIMAGLMALIRSSELSHIGKQYAMLGTGVTVCILLAYKVFPRLFEAGRAPLQLMLAAVLFVYACRQAWSVMRYSEGAIYR